MRSEQQVDAGVVNMATLRDDVRRARERRPWLSGLCDLVRDEIDLLDRRGVPSATRLDIAADVGLAVLDMIAEREDEGAWASGLPSGCERPKKVDRSS